MKHLVLESLDAEITANCNLHCAYCYQDCGELKERGDMSDEVIADTFKLIERHGFKTKAEVKFPNGRREQKGPTHISFYGGEPLLAFDRVKYFVEQSLVNRMQLRFSLLSNGTTGTKEQAEWLKKHVGHIQRSIDGLPEIQEKYRPNSIALYKEKNEIFKDFHQNRRMTIQPEFAGRILESLKWFESEGFTGGISPMPNYYAEWKDEDIAAYKKSLWDLGKYFIEKWRSSKPFYCYFFHHEIEGRLINPMSNKKFGCGGGSGLHCVSWDGYLYLCHRFSKEPHDSPFCFGSLKEILAGTAKGYGEDVYKRIAEFKAKPQPWNKECKNCIAQFGCEKGCLHSQFKCTGTLNENPKLYCEIKVEAAKVVTWIDSILRQDGPRWWEREDSFRKKQGQNNRRHSCQEFSNGTCNEFNR